MLVTWERISRLKRAAMHWQRGVVAKVKRGLFFRTLVHKEELDPPHRKQNLCPLEHYTFLRAGSVRAVSVPSRRACGSPPRRDPGTSEACRSKASDCAALARTRRGTTPGSREEGGRWRDEASRRCGGILFPGAGGLAAEGFDGTLTSGKSWPPGGKALKETITNARRKQLCGSCVELFSSEKMSVGPCEGTWKGLVGFSQPFSTCFPHRPPPPRPRWCHGGRGDGGLRGGVRATPGVPSVWAQLGGVHRPAQLHRPHPASGGEDRHLQNPTAQGTGLRGETGSRCTRGAWLFRSFCPFLFAVLHFSTARSKVSGCFCLRFLGRLVWTRDRGVPGAFLLRTWELILFFGLWARLYLWPIRCWKYCDVTCPTLMDNSQYGTIVTAALRRLFRYPSPVHAQFIKYSQAPSQGWGFLDDNVSSSCPLGWCHHTRTPDWLLQQREQAFPRGGEGAAFVLKM